MKLRICICLLLTFTLFSLIIGSGYLNLRNEYKNIAYQNITRENNYDNKNIRKTEAFYYVTLKDDQITAYNSDGKTICMKTMIDEKNLADMLIMELKNGIYIENLPDLYEYLENCSS